MMLLCRMLGAIAEDEDDDEKSESKGDQSVNVTPSFAEASLRVLQATPRRLWSLLRPLLLRPPSEGEAPPPLRASPPPLPPPLRFVLLSAALCRWQLEISCCVCLLQPAAAAPVEQKEAMPMSVVIRMRAPLIQLVTGQPAPSFSRCSGFAFGRLLVGVTSADECDAQIRPRPSLRVWRSPGSCRFAFINILSWELFLIRSLTDMLCVRTGCG